MKHAVSVWLEDIKRSITEIYEYLPTPLTFVEFENDLKTRRAVERNIEIIGGH